MKRYDSTKIIQRWDGKQVYISTQYPDIPISDNDIQIVSSEGDYLDTLAYKYYGDPTLWTIIASANNLGKGRLSIPIGTNLRIPVNANLIISEMEKLNNG